MFNLMVRIPPFQFITHQRVQGMFDLYWYWLWKVNDCIENWDGKITFFFFHSSHFSALNLLQMNKTIGVLARKIKDFVYEHNLRSYSDPLALESNTMQGTSELPGFRSSRTNIKTTSCLEPQAGLVEIVGLQEKTVLQIVDRLKLCAHRCQYTPSGPLVEMKKSIKSL